ncbi:MAG: hypothetical protein HOP30_10955 [Cyclobacteriaceae bacterium]|nr:hypothetical protein [Cyclobacteriaceae bacterium]
MKQTLTTFLLLFTTTTLFSQLNNTQLYSGVDNIKTVSGLTRAQGKLKLSKQHSDSLNYGVIQTNWSIKKSKKDTVIYLLTLSVADTIFYSEFYKPYLSDDFESWYYRKLHVTIDSTVFESLNKLKNGLLEFQQLTHLPNRGIFGYACYASGTMPEDGMKMLELVDKREAIELEKWLRDINPVKQVYSYLGLKLLQARDSISLTDETTQLMRELETSSKLVYSCSGCTFWDFVPIKSQLTTDNINRFIERNKKTK